MLRFIARFIGFWLFAGGLVAAVIDGTRSIADSQIKLTPLWETLTRSIVAPSQLNLAQGAVQEHVPVIGPWLWDAVVLNLLQLPTSLVLFVLGAVLMVVGRKRRRFARAA